MMPGAAIPRENLKWDDFFMGLTALAAQRSKDPSTQVGACIVDDANRILSIGYNGFPRGCPDSGEGALPWSREGDPAQNGLDTKYPYVVHAETNAILNKNSASVQGARMYVGLFPCNECAKIIIQSGIKEVVYLSDKYHEAASYVASRRMFTLARVAFRQHKPSMASITLQFSAPPAPAAPAPQAQAVEGSAGGGAQGQAAAAAEGSMGGAGAGAGAAPLPAQQLGEVRAAQRGQGGGEGK